jgi:hypothetical protein
MVEDHEEEGYGQRGGSRAQHQRAGRLGAESRWGREDYEDFE